jgi:superfamily II DNA or RNA helicase
VVNRKQWLEQQRHIHLGKTDCTVTIRGHRAYLHGNFPLVPVRDATSYFVEGFQFSNAYRSRKWDGRKHFFDLPTNSLPAGLAHNVVAELREYDPSGAVHLVDETLAELPPIGNHGFDLIGIEFGKGAYDYQLAAAHALVKGRRGVLKIATNGGKCLGLGTPVLRYDGRVVPVEVIKEGDLLMGPNSEPRRVMSTTRGYGQLYLIEPNKGRPWVCNDVHVLTLVNSATDQVIDVPLSEYLRTNKTFKHVHKQFSVGVDFPDTGTALPVDPYFLGVWLGDGRKDLSQGVQISKPDLEIRQLCEDTAARYGLRCVEDRYKTCPTYRIVTDRGSKNPLLDELRQLLPTPTIPRVYLTASRENRKKLLAGLLDSDGYLHNGGYDFVQKSYAIAEGTAFLARSLGHRVLVSLKEVPGYGTYYRLSMTGDFSDLPMQIPRKKAPPRRRQTAPTRTGFKTTCVGEGEYAGFTLDGDGRFLLGDFTVTHNSEISIAVTKHLALPTLFLVDGISLLTQTRQRYAKRLGIPEDDIGLIGDSKFSLGKWITIATPDSLYPRLHLPEVQAALVQWQVLWADECHHVAADTFYDVLNTIPAYFRFGLSGTPLDRADGADMKLLACTGPVLYDVPNKLLVERGISVPPYVEMIKIQQPVIPAKGVTFQSVESQAITENPHLNEAVAAKAIEHAIAGKQVLILTEKKKQAKTVLGLINGADTCTNDWGAQLKKTQGHKLVTEFLSGADDGDAREEVLARYKARAVHIIIATTIFDEGIDVPNIDVLILAAGGKGRIRLLQRVGRGLRTGQGKDRLLVVDFANFCHPWLLKHSLTRLQTYKNEDCFMISAG